MMFITIDTILVRRSSFGIGLSCWLLPPCIIPVDSYHFVVLASNPVLDFMILHIVVYHATTSTLVLSLSPSSMFIDARPGLVTSTLIDISPLSMCMFHLLIYSLLLDRYSQHVHSSESLSPKFSHHLTRLFSLPILLVTFMRIHIFISWYSMKFELIVSLRS